MDKPQTSKSPFFAQCTQCGCVGHLHLRENICKLSDWIAVLHANRVESAARQFGLDDFNRNIDGNIDLGIAYSKKGIDRVQY